MIPKRCESVHDSESDLACRFAQRAPPPAHGHRAADFGALHLHLLQIDAVGADTFSRLYACASVSAVLFLVPSRL